MEARSLKIFKEEYILKRLGIETMEKLNKRGDEAQGRAVRIMLNHGQLEGSSDLLRLLFLYHFVIILYM